MSGAGSVTTVKTTYLDSVNTCLSVLGETPLISVSATPGATEKLVRNVLFEVNNDVQARGYWFNQSTPGADITILSTVNAGAANEEYLPTLPETARRYITIRAARVCQARFLSDENLHKFTYEEELASLAVLTHTQIREEDDYDFTTYPSELKALGITEIGFLSQTAEEKLLSFRLITELKDQDLKTEQKTLLQKQILTEAEQVAKVQAETALLADQESLVTQQVFTEFQETTRKQREAELLDTQETLVAQQQLTEVQETTRKTKEAELLDTQETLVAQQQLTEVQETTKRTREHELIDAQETLLQKQILTEAEQVAKVQEEVDLLQAQESLVQKQVLTEAEQVAKVQEEVDLLQAQESLVTQQELTEVQETTRKTREAELLDTQETLVAQQKLTEVEETTRKTKEAELLDTQETLVAQQQLTEVQETTRKTKEAELLDTQETLVAQQKLTEVQETTKKQKEALLLAQQQLTEVQETTRKTREAELLDTQETLVSQQQLTEVEETTRKTKEAELLDTQETLVAQQKLTEVEETTRKTKEAELLDTQETLVAQQQLTEVQETTRKTKEADLLDTQETLVAQQKLTEVQETTRKSKEADLLDTQETLIAQQKLTEVQETTRKTKEAELLDTQELLVAQQTDEIDKRIQLTLDKEITFNDNVVAGTQIHYQDRVHEFRMLGLTEKEYYELPAYKKTEALADASALRTNVTSGVDNSNATTIEIVNNILRLIGTPPVTNANENALATEVLNALNKTTTSLQARGWWFNTFVDVDMVSDSSGRIRLDQPVMTDDIVISAELNDHDTNTTTVSSVTYLFKLKENSYTSWGDTVTYKAKQIVQKPFRDLPNEFKTWLETSTALLFLQMYPKKGIDVQRLIAQEQELETYFKDKMNDQGNYNIFDNTDTAERIGINRNYELI